MFVMNCYQEDYPDHECLCQECRKIAKYHDDVYTTIEDMIKIFSYDQIDNNELELVLKDLCSFYDINAKIPTLNLQHYKG